MAHLQLIAIFLGGAAVLAGCGEGNGSAAAKADNTQEEQHSEDSLLKLSQDELSRAGVKTSSLGRQRLAGSFSFTASVQANPERLANVAPRVPGRIASVAVRLGDRVKQGQPLALLDSIDVGEAQSAYAQAASEAAVAKAAFERAERLVADEIVPAKEYQRARGEYDKTQAALRAAAQKLRMLGVAPAAAGAGSSFPVVAPLAGTVIERRAVIGELAKPEERLFVVADLSRVWVEANVPENQLAHVKPGAAARATVAAYPDRAFQGRVGLVGAVFDKETRTAKAIIELDNVEGLLRPNMFASVTIQTGESRDVLAVPESAVTLVQGMPTVFVQQAGGGFEPRPVELGERLGGKVAIASGIEPGETIATEGVYALKARMLKSQIGDSH
jgi:cobalt-zinc-cadmium efflux system membrane fusion protein